MKSFLQLQKMNDTAQAQNASNLINNPPNFEESSLRFNEKSSDQSNLLMLQENLNNNNLGNITRMTELEQRGREIKEKVTSFFDKPPAENVNSIKLVKNEIFKSFDIENNFKTAKKYFLLSNKMRISPLPIDAVFEMSNEELDNIPAIRRLRKDAIQLILKYRDLKSIFDN